MLLRPLPWKTAPITREARVPDGWRIYVVGDIHGQAELLRKLRQSITVELATSQAEKSLTVFLGDYIDRGIDSKGVLDIVSAEPFPTPIVPLYGNHEAMLLSFLEQQDEDGRWLANGGLETLYSYGIDTSNVRYGQGIPKAASDLLKALPESHITFLQNLRLSFLAGDYFFCHAGIRPGVPLKQQRETDLLWIRGDFLKSGTRHEKVIVHGHTPVREPEIRSNRINIDTGAYISGRLTCLILEGASKRFLYADALRAGL
jgi:serine/threonine protein phosphatase 1